MEFSISDIINDTIEEIFIARGISFANLSRCYRAVTCFNQTLIINKNLIILSSIDDSENLRDNAIMFAGLLLITLHEFFHILRRTIIKKAFNPYYERTFERKLASRNNTYMAINGTVLEDRIFGVTCETIGYFDGKFLLNYKNWKNYDHDQFKQKFHEMQNLDLKKNKKSNRLVVLEQSKATTNDDNEDNDETISSITTTSAQRWKIPGCLMASSFYHFDT
jgi:hypothetical protein